VLKRNTFHQTTNHHYKKQTQSTEVSTSLNLSHSNHAIILYKIFFVFQLNFRWPSFCCLISRNTFEFNCSFSTCFELSSKLISFSTYVPWIHLLRCHQSQWKFSHHHQLFLILIGWFWILTAFPQRINKMVSNYSSNRLQLSLPTIAQQQQQQQITNNK